MTILIKLLITYQITHQITSYEMPKGLQLLFWNMQSSTSKEENVLEYCSSSNADVVSRVWSERGTGNG